MKTQVKEKKIFAPKVVKGSSEFIGYGIPSLNIYSIQPSNILPFFNEDFSINDGRPSTSQILDTHLNKYKNVWEALA